MKVVNTNKLNLLWTYGILPIKHAVDNVKLKLANNLVTTEEGYGLDARQGPVIQRQIDEINGKLGDIVSKDTFVKLLGRTTSPTGTITSPEFTNYQLLAVRIGISGWVKTEIFVNTGSYITAFINSTNADIRIRMDYVSNKITLSDFRSAGGTFNSCDVYGILPK